eukprot:m51a1_g4927 hypothetical protein (229) ;mRNA; r:256321-257588
MILSMEISAATCDTEQDMLRVYGDKRAMEMKADNASTHFSKYFTGSASFAIKTSAWRKYYSPETAQNPAEFFGRTSDVAGLKGVHQFVAPTSEFQDAIDRCSGSGSTTANCTEATKSLFQRLGIPDHDETFYVVTIDTTATPLCYRLPMEADPGAGHCVGVPDERCFKFGGFTSGGAPEILLISAPVKATRPSHLATWDMTREQCGMVFGKTSRETFELLFPDLKELL